jgi:hypothetical protein
LSGDLAEKLGQISHLDQDPSNCEEDNLAFMCLNHHSLFDSKTSQHKNYTLHELKAARSKLYGAVAENKHTEKITATGVTYNLIGPNARVNINSHDHSANAAAISTGTTPDILMSENRARLLVTLPHDASEKIASFVPSPTTLATLYILPVVRNYGKTMAVVTLFKARFLILSEGQQLPTDPDYEAADFQTVQVVTQLPPDALVQPKAGISNFDFVPVYEQKSTLWLYGLVDYRDIYGFSHQSRFCFVYHIPGGFNPNPAGFYSSGPEAYNRCT